MPWPNWNWQTDAWLMISLCSESWENDPWLRDVGWILGSKGVHVNLQPSFLKDLRSRASHGNSHNLCVTLDSNMRSWLLLKWFGANCERFRKGNSNRKSSPRSTEVRCGCVGTQRSKSHPNHLPWTNIYYRAWCKSMTHPQGVDESELAKLFMWGPSAWAWAWLSFHHFYCWTSTATVFLYKDKIGVSDLRWVLTNC